ncbi:MAG: FecR family protein [Acidobacteriota bacterium]|nr:FecR family protein [Acidobacteriota bacterium]
MPEIAFINLCLKPFAFIFIVALSFIGVKSQNLASAKILSSSGTVQITRQTAGGASRVKLRAGDELFTDDVIKTGVGGRVVVGLKDGSQAIISENTTVEIKDTNNSPRTIFNVLRGKTRIKIEKLGGKPNPYRVTTPTTVIAVRGTIFDVFVSNDETKVFVEEGEVSVALLTAPDNQVILTPGQFTRVKKDQPPQPQQQFKPGRNNEHFSQTPANGRGRSGFDNPSENNSGNGNGFPGSSGNAPGRNPNASPGNSGNAGGGRRGKP